MCILYTCKYIVNNYVSYNTVDTVYFLFIRSCEKGFITKEYVIMNEHLNLTFKRVLLFSTLAIKLFNSGKKLFHTAIAATTLQTSFL